MLGKVVSIRKSHFCPLPLTEEATKAQKIKADTEFTLPTVLPQQEDPDWALEWGPQPFSRAWEQRSTGQAVRLQTCALLPTPPF